MSFFHAFLLGIIQGLTEFIPVSSTAHLLIAQELLHIPSSDVVFSFLVIVQLGTLVSLFAFYWNDLLSIARATFDFRNATPDRDLGAFIVIATIPALIVGYFLKDLVKILFEKPILEASIRLLSAAALMTFAEWFSKKSRALASMTWLDALIVGLFQVIAVFPGMSRSGATISGGMLRGFDRPSAARFAFLMSVPVILVAGAAEFISILPLHNLNAILPLVAIGFITAAIIGWFAIKWLIAYLSKNSLYGFSAYCAVIGFILLGIQVFHA